MYYTYMLRCEDKSIYTGVTNDYIRRFDEHKNKRKECAKYTYVHNVDKIEVVFASSNKSLACKLEYWIKRLNKDKKEQIIKSKTLDVLCDVINIAEYSIVDI